MTPTTRNAWCLAFFSVLVLWGINNVVIGYSAQVLHANSLVYACSAFASAAMVLLFVGGHGPLVRETLRSIDTWAFGFILLLGYVITLNLFTYVSSTEGSLLQRISLLFSISAAWFFLSRPPTRLQLVGLLLILFGITVVCLDLNHTHRINIILLMIAEGLVLTARTFVAEFHRPHQIAMQQTQDPKARARVVGFVMFIISTIFLTLIFSIAGLQHLLGDSLNNPLLPTLNDVMHAPSIVAGLLAGILLLAPLRVIEFTASQQIKTENFIAISALSSVATLFWEWALQPLTGLALRSINSFDLVALILVTGGALVAALGQLRHQAKTPAWQQEVVYAPQDVAAVAESREMVAEALEHFNLNPQKTAAALGLNPLTLQALVADNTHTLALTPTLLAATRRRYRQDVLGADPLTALPNRARLLALLQHALKQDRPTSVLYLDLNHFKPVNDTYGHAAGDIVLQQVAKRLERLLPPGGLACRLGGDEFVLALPGFGPTAANKLAITVRRALGATITLPQGQRVRVGAAVGIASAPNEAHTPENLIKVADKQMYMLKQALHKAV